MTEFDYDVLQRKKLAQQAKYRKNGSRSRKCTLRQDHMTNAQLKRMNGEVVRFHMNKPIRSWAEFRGLSKESAREYINRLAIEYSASIGDLSRMFGVTYNTVKKYVTAIGAVPSAGRMPAEIVPVWEAFLEDKPETPPEEPAIVEPENEPIEEEATLPSMSMREFTFEFSGDINFTGVVNSLKYILGDAPSGVLRVEFRASE